MEPLWVLLLPKFPSLAGSLQRVLWPPWLALETSPRRIHRKTPEPFCLDAPDFGSAGRLGPDSWRPLRPCHPISGWLLQTLPLDGRRGLATHRWPRPGIRLPIPWLGWVGLVP